VIVVAPRFAVAPATGDCVTDATPQLSAATTLDVKSGTCTVQFVSAFALWSEPQLVIVGAVVSLTVNVTVCGVELPLPSATVIVTTVAPSPTDEPADGTCVTTTAVQLSVATTWDA